jgi:energy-coupling factor transport system ATP-binding protein
MDEAVLADRVVVMDGGNILIQGTPREVFSHVELLKQHQLDVPQATELIYRLKASGCNLPDGILNEEECVAALELLLDENKKR